MKCSKCQAENADGAQYCTNCGASLKEVVAAPDGGENVVAAEVAEEVVAQNGAVTGQGYSETVAEQVVEKPAAAQAPQSESAEKVNFFTMIKRVFTKPATMLGEDLPKYGNAKNAGIMAAIALVSSVVLGIVGTLISAVFGFSCYRGCKLKFDIDMLKYVKFGDVLFNGFASTIVTMLVVAGVFFGMAQIFKYKKVNFWKLLTTVSVVMFPMMAMSFVAAIVGIFSTAWAMVVSMIGMLYAVIIFYEGITKETQAESDKKIYYVFLSTVAMMVAMMLIAWLIGEKIGMVSLLKLLDL